MPLNCADGFIFPEPKTREIYNPDSQRQIKRRLKFLNLKRRGTESPLVDIITAVNNEIQIEGRDAGINIMWKCLQTKYNLLVKRQTVRDVMDVLLPGELYARRRQRLSRRVYTTHGPIHVWHIDQYDKLASFGFFIHGAMDGFSRKIVWLKVGNTNRNSATILNFYLEYCKSVGGIAKLLRTDARTENSLMLDVHAFFHSEDALGNRSFIIGRSVHNQRIERFWVFLRTHFTQYWMDLFHDMMSSHLYCPTDDVQYQLLQFCFTGVLRRELDALAGKWNHHKVRKSAIAECAVGVPEVLYSVPELYNTADQKSNVSHNLLSRIEQTMSNPLLEYGCDDEFAELCLYLMLIHGYRFPETSDDALNLYGELLGVILNFQL